MATYTFNNEGVGVRAQTALSLAGSAGGTNYAWINNSGSAVNVDYTLSAATVSVSFDNGVSVLTRPGTRQFTAVIPARSGGLI